MTPREERITDLHLAASSAFKRVLVADRRKSPLLPLWERIYARRVRSWVDAYRVEKV